MTQTHAGYDKSSRFLVVKSWHESKAGRQKKAGKLIQEGVRQEIRADEEKWAMGKGLPQGRREKLDLK